MTQIILIIITEKVENTAPTSNTDIKNIDCEYPIKPVIHGLTRRAYT